MLILEEALKEESNFSLRAKDKQIDQTDTKVTGVGGDY